MFRFTAHVDTSEPQAKKLKEKALTPNEIEATLRIAKLRPEMEYQKRIHEKRLEIIEKEGKEKLELLQLQKTAAEKEQTEKSELLQLQKAAVKGEAEYWNVKTELLAS